MSRIKEVLEQVVEIFEGDRVGLAGSLSEGSRVIQISDELAREMVAKITDRASTGLTWPEALEAMELGHNVASAYLKKHFFHVHAFDKNLGVLELVNTLNGVALVTGYIPTCDDRTGTDWEIIRTE